MGNSYDYSPISVLTLNYSSTFVSPFEYYAMDNWAQLQKIGLIFENNIKEAFPEIKQKAAEISGEEFSKQKSYIRKQFDWKIGRLDKQNKKRYSPLYIEQTSAEELRNYMYPGINQKYFLMYEVEYFEKWQGQWGKTQLKLSGDGKNKINFAEFYLCRRFDFECYRAIVQYLYNLPTNRSILKPSLGICSNNTMIPFEQIVQYIRDVKQPQKRVQLIGIYRDFMASYFKRIDLPAKLKKTEHYLFEKYDFEIINLQEVNPELLELIRKQNKYYYFTPGMLEKDIDQCVVLVKKSSRLVPEYFSRHFQEEMDSVQQLKNEINETLKSQQTLKNKKDMFIKAIKNHFNQKSSKKFISSFNQVAENQYPKYIPFLKLELNSLIMNPLKADMEEWVKKYQHQFLKFWLDKLLYQQHKVVKPFLDDIKEHGLLFWSEAFTLVTFKFTNKDLQEDPLNENPIIIGSFHLSSKEVKNRVQIQILGLLIYELTEHGYRFIFGGDFNSYVISSQKNDKEGLFTFVQHFYKKDKEKLEKIKQMLNIHIYPKHEKIHTTKKKRTILQVQTNKTNLLATKCVDQIISNVPIKLNDCYTGEIKNLNSKQNKNKHFIPNKKHPYDHFAVKAIIDLSQEVHPESK